MQSRTENEKCNHNIELVNFELIKIIKVNKQKREDNCYIYSLGTRTMEHWNQAWNQKHRALVGIEAAPVVCDQLRLPKLSFITIIIICNKARGRGDYNQLQSTYDFMYSLEISCSIRLSFHHKAALQSDSNTCNKCVMVIDHE